MKTKIVEQGNWNYKDKGFKPVYTKPIGVVNFEKKEKVFTHEEIFEIIKLYDEADIRSIEMIASEGIDTGNVKSFETPFLVKLKRFIGSLR